MLAASPVSAAPVKVKASAEPEVRPPGTKFAKVCERLNLMVLAAPTPKFIEPALLGAEKFSVPLPLEPIASLALALLEIALIEAPKLETSCDIEIPAVLPVPLMLSCRSGFVAPLLPTANIVPVLLAVIIVLPELSILNSVLAVLPLVAVEDAMEKRVPFVEP